MVFSLSKKRSTKKQKKITIFFWERQIFIFKARTPQTSPADRYQKKFCWPFSKRTFSRRESAFYRRIFVKQVFFKKKTAKRTECVNKLHGAGLFSLKKILLSTEHRTVSFELRGLDCLANQFSFEDRTFSTRALWYGQTASGNRRTDMQTDEA